MDNLYEIRHGRTAHVDHGFPSLSRLHTLTPTRPTFHRAQPNFKGPPLINRFAGTQGNEYCSSEHEAKDDEQSTFAELLHGGFTLARSFNIFKASSTIRSPVPASAQLCSPVQV